MKRIRRASDSLVPLLTILLLLIIIPVTARPDTIASLLGEVSTEVYFDYSSNSSRFGFDFGGVSQIGNHSIVRLTPSGFFRGVHFDSEYIYALNAPVMLLSKGLEKILEELLYSDLDNQNRKYRRGVSIPSMILRLPNSSFHIRTAHRFRISVFMNSDFLLYRNSRSSTRGIFFTPSIGLTHKIHDSDYVSLRLGYRMFWSFDDRKRPGRLSLSITTLGSSISL